MSIYSDYKVGALSDDEFRWCANRENMMDRCERSREDDCDEDEEEEDDED